MKQSEFKRRYDPNTGKFTRQHIWNKNQEIHGEGIIDKFKSVWKKTTPPPKPMTRTKKSGDKIVKMPTAHHKVKK